MKIARQYNAMWAVLAGLSLLAIQGGHNSGSASFAQSAPPAASGTQQTGQRPSATGEQRPPQTGTTAQPAPAAGRTQPATPPAAHTTTQAAAPCTGNCAANAATPASTQPLDSTARLPLVEVVSAVAAQTPAKKKCEDEESGLKHLECLVENLSTNPTKEDRDAFVFFILGTNEVTRCNSGDTEEYAEGEKYGESAFRDTVDTDPKEARKVMSAFRKGIDKLGDNKSRVFCHGMNIARVTKSETMKKTLEARLRNIDRQIEVARTRGDAYGLQRVMELEHQRRGLAAQYARFDAFGNPNGGLLYDYDRIFSRTAADYFRTDREAYDMDIYGSRGAFDDVYSWLRDISVGQSPSFYDDTRIAGGRARDQWYRARMAGYGGRSSGYPGELGRLPPAYGSSALQALINGQLPGTTNSYLPATQIPDLTYRGQTRGRPLADLNVDR
ncbi:MAG TPA: hypothetical protein VFV50_10075 [Bdellovibrionales bacterium]|nr:hypothetical protein [Bdellovibrionales bacterium]